MTGILRAFWRLLDRRARRREREAGLLRARVDLAVADNPSRPPVEPPERTAEFFRPLRTDFGDRPPGVSR